MIRVLIVDEVRAVCETLAAALRGEADLEVSGCATNLDEALPHLAASDVVLLNTHADGEAALHPVRVLRRLSARARIVVMGLEPGHRAVAACLEAGAAQCVTKASPLEHVLERVRAAHHQAAGAQFPALGTALRAYLAEWMGFDRGLAVEDDAPPRLTRREREVLTLVRQGLTNQEIAETLVIELGTVKNHVHNILRKLNVRSRREAVQVSRLAGLWGPVEHRGQMVGPRYAAERPLLAAVTVNS